MSYPVVTLTKDAWVKVFTAVNYIGQACIVDQDIEPTAYEVAVIATTGDPAPAVDYEGGVPFKDCMGVGSVEVGGSDYYIKAVNADGKIVVMSS